MESNGSLPCSQETATDPYPQPVESSLHSHILLIKIPFRIFALVFPVDSSFKYSDILCIHFLRPPTRATFSPFYNVL
jgi:hypothetical protein